MKKSAAVTWDVENTKVPNHEPINHCQATKNIERALESALENINIDDFIVCGNMKPRSVSSNQRKQIYKGGGALVDVPIGIKNAADMELMIQMAKYALVHPPPACLTLISGDRDMCQSLQAFTEQGYTTLLAYPKGTHAELKLSSDYCVPWESLYSGTLHGLKKVREGPQGPYLSRYATKTVAKDVEDYSCRNFCYMGCKKPMDLQHYQVFRFITDKVEEVIGLGKSASPAIRVFGENHTLPPRGEKFPGIKFRETSGDKEESQANSMMAYILKLVMNNQAPINIVLITAMRGFEQVATFLRRSRYRVFIATTAGATDLKDSASLLFTWPPPSPTPPPPTPRRVRSRLN